MKNLTIAALMMLFGVYAQAMGLAPGSVCPMMATANGQSVCNPTSINQVPGFINGAVNPPGVGYPGVSSPIGIPFGGQTNWKPMHPIQIIPPGYIVDYPRFFTSPNSPFPPVPRYGNSPYQPHISTMRL